MNNHAESIGLCAAILALLTPILPPVAYFCMGEHGGFLALLTAVGLSPLSLAVLVASLAAPRLAHEKRQTRIARIMYSLGLASV